MLVDTKSLVVNTDAKTLFSFLADPENLPKWAIHYCKSIRKEGDDFIITTPHGDMFYQVDSCAESGIVDMKSGPQKDALMTFPARVTALPDGTALFSLTCIMMEDLSDDELAGLKQSFAEEFDALKQAVA